MPSPPTVLVLGAGPAGLSAALALRGSATLLERGEHPGGLASSIEIDGAIFDLGGHSFWTPHADVRRLVNDALPMVEQPRRARCWFRGQVVDYPFQRHFEQLSDPDVRAACRAGLADRDTQSDTAKHFEAHLVQRFGQGLAEHFLLPYNRKLWACDLKTLAADWTAERVAAPSAREEAHDLARGERVPLQEDSRVAYPEEGGFGEIFTALARQVVDLRLNSEVMWIDAERRTVGLGNGTELPYERLVSTLPLPHLLRRIRNAPADLLASAESLRTVSLSVVLAVVDAPLHTDVQRFYVADPRLLPHKIALNHNSSPWLKSRPRHGVIAEVSFSTDKPLPANVETRVVRDLAEVGAIRSVSDVRSTRRIDLEYGYPAPTHDRAERVASIKAWLARHGIATLGRFGEWDYINSDECLRRGLALGRALAGELGA
jgi:protoporphyrinogen oxidase